VLEKVEAELWALKDKLSPPKSQWRAIRRELTWPLEERDLLKTMESISEL
jgi:hypothetical protein